MLEAYVNHGPWGHSTHAEKVPVKITKEIPLKGQTKLGYGKGIPTQYMIKYNHRWSRVKVTIYSNNGTPWALVNGVRSVVRIDHWSE